MKKVKKINYKILLFILLFVGFLIFIPSTSNAWSNNQLLSGVTIGYKSSSYNTYSLIGTKNLYCVWHGGSLSSYVTNTYYARYKIAITGKTAIVYKSNGTSFVKKGSKTSTYNAMICWLLNEAATGNSGNYAKYYSTGSGYTTTQKALYYFFGTWLSESRSVFLR